MGFQAGWPSPGNTSAHHIERAGELERSAAAQVIAPRRLNDEMLSPEAVLEAEVHAQRNGRRGWAGGADGRAAQMQLDVSVGEHAMAAGGFRRSELPIGGVQQAERVG